MRIGPAWTYAAILAYPLGSSLLGLGNAMLTAGARIFGIVWGASLLGDILFVGGSLVVGWAAFELARRRRLTASIAVGLLGTWLVYTLAWSVTGPAISPENNADFARAEAASWVFTFQWGWPGILFAAAGPPLSNHALNHRPNTARTHLAADVEKQA